jgi:hypothetical protein
MPVASANVGKKPSSGSLDRAHVHAAFCLVGDRAEALYQSERPWLTTRGVSRSRSCTRFHRGQSMRQRRERTVQNDEALRGTCKVLIFDEDVEDLARQAEPFEAHGFEVYKCTSIETAMRCVEREEFDFAFVDQVSPAFEGLRVIRHLVRYNLPRQHHRQWVKTLFSCGKAGSVWRSHCDGNQQRSL